MAGGGGVSVGSQSVQNPAKLQYEPRVEILQHGYEYAPQNTACWLETRFLPQTSLEPRVSPMNRTKPMLVSRGRMRMSSGDLGCTGLDEPGWSFHAKNKYAHTRRAIPFSVLGFEDKNTGICAGAMPYRRDVLTTTRI